MHEEWGSLDENCNVKGVRIVIRMKIIDLNDCNVGSVGGRYDT